MNPTLRTIGLFILLTLIFVGVGYIIGFYLGNSIFGILVFLILALIINLISYFFSAKLVLFSYGAKIIDEKENTRIFSIVRNVATRAGIPMPKIALINTDIPNAFATGRNKNHAVVAVTTGLLNMLNDDEIEGVIGHEVSHIKNRDILIMTVVATIVGALTFLSRVYMLNAIFGGNGKNRENDIIALFITMLAALGALLLQLAISRQREYKADYSGARITGKPLALASALRKIENYVRRKPLTKGNPSTSSLFIVNPFRSGSLIHLFSTHPPTEERIKRLEDMARKGLSIETIY